MSRRREIPPSSTITRRPSIAPARRSRTDSGDEEPLEPTVTEGPRFADRGQPPRLPNDEIGKEEPTQPVRARMDTMDVPTLAALGEPPALPPTDVRPVPPPPLTVDVERPTFMPGPRDVPPGSPDDRAAPPGYVPAGDSRSLRRGNEFALIYRIGNAVISRFGIVGTRGQWRVVEYPTTATASHAYARESSRFVSEGFSDYRG